jgi:hypothetical protein
MVRQALDRREREQNGSCKFGKAVEGSVSIRWLQAATVWPGDEVSHDAPTLSNTLIAVALSFEQVEGDWLRRPPQQLAAVVQVDRRHDDEPVALLDAFVSVGGYLGA